MSKPTGRMWRAKKVKPTRSPKRKAHRWRERADACGLSLVEWIRVVVTRGRDEHGQGLRP